MSEETNEIKLSANAQKVMDMVEAMTVVELNDLVKALEDKFGVSAAAPMVMGVAPQGGEAAVAAPADEQTEFDVILAEVGANKMGVIKAVREINQNLGLVDAKTLVESAPKPVIEAANKENAQAAKAKLEEAGAKVELK